MQTPKAGWHFDAREQCATLVPHHPYELQHSVPHPAAGAAPHVPAAFTGGAAFDVQRPNPAWQPVPHSDAVRPQRFEAEQQFPPPQIAWALAPQGPDMVVENALEAAVAVVAVVDAITTAPQVPNPA